MRYSTYSFTDVTAVISHPSYGQFSVNGEGIGNFSVDGTLPAEYCCRRLCNDQQDCREQWHCIYQCPADISAA